MILFIYLVGCAIAIIEKLIMEKMGGYVTIGEIIEAITFSTLSWIVAIVLFIVIVRESDIAKKFLNKRVF